LYLTERTSRDVVAIFIQTMCCNAQNV